MQAALLEHLRTGSTTVCRCWAVARRDGVVMGFTDHDRELSFEGITFRADTGLTARAVSQTTGLSIDNSEALGALSDLSIREEDILAGRFDGATVTAWEVNWVDVAERSVVFKGSLGEITRGAGAFTAELLGLSEPLNRARGRIYQHPCSAVLGDASCGFDLGQPGYGFETAIDGIEESRVLRVADPGGFAGGWFGAGRVRVLNGVASGLVGVVKADRVAGGLRVLELWEAFGLSPAPGDQVRIEAGCDKRAETCRDKFSNYLNFRGFPHIPGEDWLMAYPKSSGRNDGGSLAS
jgi:uncharacterized phage protein (TIGR02218 family)